MDSKNQVISYEIHGQGGYLENRCAYQDKSPCLKYYVQPNTNMLLQLYQE